MFHKVYIICTLMYIEHIKSLVELIFYPVLIFSLAFVVGHFFELIGVSFISLKERDWFISQLHSQVYKEQLAAEKEKSTSFAQTSGNQAWCLILCLDLLCEVIDRNTEI